MKYCVDCTRHMPADHFNRRIDQLKYAVCEVYNGDYCSIKNPDGDCPAFSKRGIIPEILTHKQPQKPLPVPEWLIPNRTLSERWMKLCMGW